MSERNVLHCVANMCLAVAVVIGYFAPPWLVGALAGGWLFNAAIFFRRVRSSVSVEPGTMREPQ